MPAELTPQQRERERALGVVVVLDVAATLGLLACGALADSLTLLADGLRGVFILLVEIWAWITLRRIHRGRFLEYDFGTGKIERLVNVGIAFSLLGAAAWIAWTALHHLDREPSSSAVFFLFAVLISEYNLVVNAYGLWGFVRANRGRPSLILEAQIGARAVKTVSSLVVFSVVLLSGVVPDPTVGGFLDVLGSLFVCTIMARTAMRQLRESVPDLLDRSLTDTTQIAVYRALAESFDDYEDVVGVRSRRSGQQLLIELELGFESAVTVAQVALLESRLAERIRAALPEARVRVVPVVSDPLEPSPAAG